MRQKLRWSDRGYTAGGSSAPFLKTKKHHSSPKTGEERRFLRYGEDNGCKIMKKICTFNGLYHKNPLMKWL